MCESSVYSTIGKKIMEDVISIKIDGEDIKSVSCDDYVMKMTIITRYIMCPKCEDMITLKEEGREWD